VRLYLQWSQSVSSVFCCLAGNAHVVVISHTERVLWNSPRQMIWLKYFTDVNTLGSQCVHSILWQPVKNRPEDDCSIVETCSLHINLCNKNSCVGVQISIPILRTLYRRLSTLYCNIQTWIFGQRDKGENDYRLFYTKAILTRSTSKYWVNESARQGVL